MPSDSPLQAIVEYSRSKTVGGNPIRAYRDTAPAEEGGVAVVPPYAVVADDGGGAVRDLEGNEFGPQSFRLTVYAGDPAVARQIFDTIVYGGTDPDTQQGIEASGALLPYLTGYSQVEVMLDRRPQEGRGRARNVTAIQNTVAVRLQVFTTRS